MEKKNIALIGFRGTGKTRIGMRLAKRLSMDFVDTDKMVEKEAGKSVAEIFNERGEAGFRELEKLAVERASRLENTCIACGGGVVLEAGNVENIRKSCVVVLLESDPKTIYARIRHDKNRPSLTKKEGLEEVEHLLNARREAYEGAADFKVDSGDCGLDECSQRIIDLLYEKGII